jgi:phosphoribosylcarboxyaminoimidazole (NCAIR) mutase
LTAAYKSLLLQPVELLILSTVQMPGDVPVASMAVGMGGPRNAGLFAVQIMATARPDLREKLAEFKQRLVGQIEAKNAALQRAIEADA